MDRQEFTHICDEILVSLQQQQSLMEDIYTVKYQQAAETAPQEVEEHLMDAAASADDMVEHFKAAKGLLKP